jgi:radical SAM superfamily enzyme YgiQ (UPF0313 family)
LSTLTVLLIKPSKYDDDGYVMRFVRGVLPSNTLATLAALTERVAERGELGPVRVRLRSVDEHVSRVDPARLARRYRRRGGRLVVALCGVQTNQFPRAADLAREFRAEGVPVLMGGFHVSGSIAMNGGAFPPECEALMAEGVTLVKGEVENRWSDLLKDALHDRLRPYYDVSERPDLSDAPVPTVDPGLNRKYAYPFMGTIDTARGCPFHCSFCTIINVQGRVMRHRPVDRILERVRTNRRKRIDYYFFTDDNFSRNPVWEEILDGLVELREREGIAVQFMMQVDTTAHRIPRFVEKAARAGCTQVFLGVESLREENLAGAGKTQNKVGDYRDMIAAWHAAGIACHAAVIVGFPHDTPESVHADVIRLRDDIGADQASFFILMPLPGSRDHRDMLRRGDWMDGDYNRFDSIHAVMRHARMSAEEWVSAYLDAWRTFYSVEGMKQILSRANAVTYWGLFKNFAWYKHSLFVERCHPMMGGFFRIKDRLQRRPGLSVDGRWRHLRARLRDFRAWVRGTVAIYFEMQEVWLATRGRAGIQQSVDDLRKRYEEARGRLAISFRSYRNPLSIRVRSRAELNAYWRQTYEALRRGRLLRINPVRLTWNALRDAKLCIRFNVSFLAAFAR